MLSEFREFLKLKGKDLEEDKYETYMIHSKYNNKRAKTGDEKLAVSRESSGTQKFYFLLYPILFVLHYGGILLKEIASNGNLLFSRYI